MLHRTHSETAQHILTYAQQLQGGGVERAMLRMAAGWQAAGRRVTLVLGSREGPLAAEIPDGIEVIELGDGRHQALFRLADEIRRARPDLLFCPGNRYTGVTALARLRLGSTPVRLAIAYVAAFVAGKLVTLCWAAVLGGVAITLHPGYSLDQFLRNGAILIGLYAFYHLLRALGMPAPRQQLAAA